MDRLLEIQGKLPFPWLEGCTDLAKMTQLWDIALTRPADGFAAPGARDLIAQAVEAEPIAFRAGHADQTDAVGHRRPIRHGYLPEREVQTGIGAVPVKGPRVRDRVPQGGRLRFTSTILPPYLRRAKSIEELLAWLYRKGISTGDFSEALAALPGPDAPDPSATSITRLKADGWDDYERWPKRDLSVRRQVYFAARSFGSGPTASTSPREWTRIVHVCWRLSVPSLTACKQTIAGQRTNGVLGRAA